MKYSASCLNVSCTAVSFARKATGILSPSAYCALDAQCENGSCSAHSRLEATEQGRGEAKTMVSRTMVCDQATGKGNTRHETHHGKQETKTKQSNTNTTKTTRRTAMHNKHMMTMREAIRSNEHRACTRCLLTCMPPPNKKSNDEKHTATMCDNQNKCFHTGRPPHAPIAPHHNEKSATTTHV